MKKRTDNGSCLWTPMTDRRDPFFFAGYTRVPVSGAFQDVASDKFHLNSI